MKVEEAEDLSEVVRELIARLAAAEVVQLRLIAHIHGDQLLSAFTEVPTPEGLSPEALQHHERVNEFLRSRARLASSVLVRARQPIAGKPS